MADSAKNMIPDASSEEKAVAPSADKAKKQGKKNASDKKPNFFVRIGRRIGKFFRDCISEMKKVVWMSGNDVRHGLIGPGVYASHGYERSHVDAVENTLKLMLAYVGAM